MDRELLGWHDQTSEVLSDVWDDASDAEHLLPWLGEVRAQAGRVMRSSSVVHELRQAKGDDATLAAFAAAAALLAAVLAAVLVLAAGLLLVVPLLDPLAAVLLLVPLLVPLLGL